MLEMLDFSLKESLVVQTARILTTLSQLLTKQHSAIAESHSVWLKAVYKSDLTVKHVKAVRQGTVHNIRILKKKSLIIGTI